jgi:transcriptional regulator with XRE-family HTH domain
MIFDHINSSLVKAGEPMNINERVGRRIKMRRIEIGLTQAELAQQLTIGQSNLSYIERGKRDVSVSLLEEIARALRCKPEDFFQELKDVA